MTSDAKISALGIRWACANYECKPVPQYIVRIPQYQSWPCVLTATFSTVEISSPTYMYPSGQPLSGATTRKFRPLPPRPSQRQSRDFIAYSGKYYHNRTSDIISLSASSSEATQIRDNIVCAHAISESKTILDHTPPSNGAAVDQAIFHDQWTRLGFIGKGNYGQVFRAIENTTGYIFAVKEVDSKIKRRTLVQALQDERETLKELKHPNIVQYLGFEEDQGVLNIFLEYVPGGTIHSCVNTHGRFKEEVTKSFASQILQGLSYLHSKSILHRDLKSENILVEPRGICKISDFGISKKALEANRGRLYSTMKGTIAYMAPEMIDDKKKGYDSKIDIWSVGCIVFEMWTGKTPWSGKEHMQIVMKLYIEKLPPPLPDNVSLPMMAESFRQASFHCDPEKRPSAVELLQHAYLKLPPQWAFPGVDNMGQVLGHSTQEQDSYETIYSDLEAITGELDFSTANHAQKSPSPARTMYSDVMDPRSPSPALINLTPPRRSRKQRNLSNNLGAHTTTSLTISSLKNPTLNARRPLVFDNTDSDDAKDARDIISPGYSERRPFFYQPPPLPELNNLSPYSHGLVPPISIRFNKPISQAFSKSTTLLDPSSITGSVAHKVDCPVNRREAPYMSPESDDDDDDDNYSPSTWQRPPVNIVGGVSQAAKPVEPVSDWNIPPIHHRHRLLPSAIPRPSIETVYKGFLSENVENVDPPDAHVAQSPSDSKRRNTMKSIREIVEGRLYQAQIGAAQSPQRVHFWDSHIEDIKA